MVIKLTAAALAASGGGTLLGAPSPATVTRESFVMGTVLRVEVEAPTREEGLAAIERAFGEVRRLDGVLSSWREGSEVGRLNAAAAGEAVTLSPGLWEMLEEARRWTAATDGAFDPGVGALTDAWGLRGEGRVPGEGELAAALARTGIARFDFAAAERTATPGPSAGWIDTGAFGKGAALDAAARALREAGVESALLDFGGQLLAMGPAETEVAVAHPSRREEAWGALRLREASVSTTSQSERWVEAAGERIGHVLDPRSGRPVPAWGSVTVVARDALVADVLSTALFVMGPVAGREWASRLDEVAVLFLEERGGTVVASSNAAFERLQTTFMERNGSE